jgi:hypothetical protein
VGHQPLCRRMPRHDRDCGAARVMGAALAGRCCDVVGVCEPHRHGCADRASRPLRFAHARCGHLPHESPRTTKLYDRTKERLPQDEIERIVM